MIGVDEVGRGSLAGPLLVAAARQKSALPAGLCDSKLLTKAQRLQLSKLLMPVCEFGEGWVTAVEIDNLGLSRALKLGAVRALADLTAGYQEEIILDGSFNYIPKEYVNSKCQIRADNQVAIVSAASIYAKVRRDEFMRKLQADYPDYGFESHVGYGTRQHLAVLNSRGALAGVHRFSFNPIKVSIQDL